MKAKPWYTVRHGISEIYIRPGAGRPHNRSASLHHVITRPTLCALPFGRLPGPNVVAPIKIGAFRSSHTRTTKFGVSRVMSDDEFGLSSGDEAEMAAAATMPASSGKHQLGSEDATHPAKRLKTAQVSSASNRLLANKVLKEQFGLNGFRLEQEAAITRLLDGGSAVVVFPTGGGKSLCYQVSSCHDSTFFF